MIIVEGPDGAGKTTLINRLKHVTGFPVAPRVVSQRAEAMVDLKAWVEENLEQGFQTTIYDRHRLISEPIYGPILRDMPEPGFSDVGWMSHRLYELYNVVRPFIIYCLPPLERVQYNVVNGEDDNEVVLTKINKVYSAYVNKAANDVIGHHGLIILYDYTNEPEDWSQVLQAIKNLAEERVAANDQ